MCLAHTGLRVFLHDARAVILRPIAARGREYVLCDYLSDGLSVRKKGPESDKNEKAFKPQKDPV